jgi:hypothetical protein
MSELKKITAFVPADLLASAQAYTGQGVTETIRMALERLAHAEWSQQLAALRGKVRLDIDLDEMRQDREFDDHGDIIR